MAEVPGEAQERDRAHHREQGAGEVHRREQHPGEVHERDEPPDATEQPRIRKIRDARVLRAVAHPLRLGILDELLKDGPLTATELAERLGETPANCSWHLRQLAQYGFVEETGGGRGRQRPWRAVVERKIISFDDGEPEVARAVDAAAEVIDDRAFEAVRVWRARRRSLPRPWRDASFSTHSIAWLTAEELVQIQAEIDQLMERHVDRSLDPARRPPGARPVRLMAWGFPVDGADAADTGSHRTEGDQEGRDDQ